MERRKQYARDTMIESMVSEFVDQNFWHKLCDGKRALATRHSDKQHQFAGVDVSLSCSSGAVVNFDEKAKTYGCLNQSMTVLSFECSFVNKSSQLQKGWLLQHNSTDYYMFIQLSATVDDTRLLEESSQVKAADVTWIKKSDVLQLLQSEMSIDQLESDMKSMREDELGAMFAGGRVRQKYEHGKFWLTWSSSMDEQPINLVVPTSILLGLPHTKHFIVTREKVKKA